MATFQLGSLPNLQIANSNAPQASDANTALAFIRQNNEDQRQGANNLGLQALQAIKDITQTHQQFQQQQKQAAFQKKWVRPFPPVTSTECANSRLTIPSICKPFNRAWALWMPIKIRRLAVRLWC